MNKSLLIIQREYLTRVRKKTFVISTILLPALYLLLIFGMGYLARSTKKLRVAVIDQSGLFDKGTIARSNGVDSSSYLEYVSASPDSVKKHFTSMGFDGYVEIPPTDWKNESHKVTLFTDKTHGIQSIMGVQSKLNSIWNNVKYQKLGIDEATRSTLDRNRITLEEENLKDKGANAGISSAVGYIGGFLIYFILLIYGSQVMMGVMEEKTNRIAEVMVSSVRPFQLMLGKIIGISLVALTQFLLWVALAFVVYNVTKGSMGANNAISGTLANVQDIFSRINLPLILFCFAFYMLGGFFFYSSLYAAIGSAVNEDMREAQSLSFPVTMLVIFAIAMMTAATADPTGELAFWGSIIPFSSPIVMMARIPFGVPGTVPVWQLVLSMGLLVAGFLFTTWFAGKIYRIGILMYGKKPSWKEMIKWTFRKS